MVRFLEQINEVKPAVGGVDNRGEIIEDVVKEQGATVFSSSMAKERKHNQYLYKLMNEHQFSGINRTLGFGHSSESNLLKTVDLNAFMADLGSLLARIAQHQPFLEELHELSQSPAATRAGSIR